jgi:hypothetical protein
VSEPRHAAPEPPSRSERFWSGITRDLRLLLLLAFVLICVVILVAKAVIG